MPTAPLLGDLARALTDLPAAEPAAIAHAALLAADHLVSVESAATGHGGDDPSQERAAARAFLASIGDRDDVHWGQLVHPGAIVWSVVFEVAREVGATGIDVLRAARIGYEAMVRLAALLPRESRAPFHVTALVGPTGAAAAASALLDPAGVVAPHALGHAFSVAGGSSGALLELADTRAFHRAHAARTGIAAARAALGGVRATEYDLERRGGAFAVAAALEPAAVAALDAPEASALADTSVRVFPTNGWNQAAYEAARTAALRCPGAVTAIRVAVPAGTARRSTGGGDPWNSLEAAVAAAAAEGAGDARPARELLSLVEVDGSGTGPAATVGVRTTGGSGTASISEPLGHPSRPVPIAELARTWGLGLPSASDLVDALEAALSSSRPFAVPHVTAPRVRRSTP